MSDYVDRRSGVSDGSSALNMDLPSHVWKFGRVDFANVPRQDLGHRVERDAPLIVIHRAVEHEFRHWNVELKIFHLSVQWKAFVNKEEQRNTKNNHSATNNT